MLHVKNYIGNVVVVESNSEVIFQAICIENIKAGKMLNKITGEKKN